MTLKALLIVVFSLMINTMQLNACHRQSPLIWNMERLNNLKQNPDKYSLYNKCLDNATLYAEKEPVVVTNKIISFAADKHYYCSLSVYYWPDNDNPQGPYICIDGKANPEYLEYDRPRLEELVLRLKTLSVAFYLTRDIVFYRAYIKQLNAWFLDSGTYMYPNFKYAEVRIGRNNNMGTPAGIVEAYRLTDVLESFRLVDSVKRINRKTRNGVKAWFSSLLIWMLTDENCIKSREGNNNIPLCLDVLLANISVFCGDKTTFRQIVDEFPTKRLLAQIQTDGSQPNELVRASGFGYSVVNLRHILDFCIMLQNLNIDFYGQFKGTIDSAFIYLDQFVGHNEEFPYKQASWTDKEDSYRMQVMRLERLGTKHTIFNNFDLKKGKDPFSNVERVLN